jgi:hypothetical protein
VRLIRYEEHGWVLDDYVQYLAENAAAFPSGARSFATANWHFDFKHSQCPHDSWLEEFSIREAASGRRRQVRSVGITAKFFGAHHDGYFDLLYEGVSSYSLKFSAGKGSRGHGDWIVDEITISDTNAIHHEILLSEATISIDCTDFRYHWTSITTRTNGSAV